MSAALDRLVDKLGVARDDGVQVMTHCPAHDDRTPSLALRPIEGSVLVHCHAGCDTLDVLAAAGLSMADLYDDRRGVSYTYDDGRVVHRSPDKRFRQSGNTTGTAVLYRRDRVIEAARTGRKVYVAEGEADVHALESVGVVATTSPMGAGNWSKVDPSPLAGADVVIVADNDEPGMKYAADVAATLDGLAASVSVVRARTGKDAADHLAAGHGLEEMVPITLGPPPDRGRRVRLVPASTIPLDRPRWLWDTAPPGAAGPDVEGRVPAGMLTIGAGPAGIGKSQHLVWLTAHLTRGTLPGCYYGTPRSVIYAAAEDSWPMTIAPRLVAAGADLARVFRIDVEDVGEPHARLTLPRDTAALEGAIRSHDVALIGMDPLLSLVDAQVNDYRAREVRSALEPLVEVADRTGCALFGLAHFTKASGTDPLLLISGSGAFGQVIRAGIGYARDEDAGGFVLSTIKSNIGREDLPSLSYTIDPAPVPTGQGEAWVSRLVFGAAAERSVRDLLRDSTRTDDERTERDEAVRWLTDYLEVHGGQVGAGDAIKAAAAAGIAKTTLTRARGRAGVSTAKGGLHDGWVWSLTGRRTHEEPEGSTPESVSSSVPSPVPSPPDPGPDDPPGTVDDAAEALVVGTLGATRIDHRTDEQREADRRRDAVFGPARRSA